MVDVEDRHPIEERTVRFQDGTDPLQLAAVAHDEQVVVDIGRRLPAEGVHAGQELVHRRHRIRAHGRGHSPIRLDE